MSLLYWYEESAIDAAPHVRNAAVALGRSAYEVQLVKTFDELRAGLEKHRADAVVLDWNACGHPAWFLERYLQDPALVTTPLVIVTGRPMDGRQAAYLTEYQCDPPVEVNPGIGSNALRNEIVQASRQKDAKGKLKERVRKFFALMHGERFDEAEEFLVGHLDTSCSEADGLFYRAHLSKARKDFAGATELLARALKLTAREDDLEPRFLHLLGNVAFLRRDFVVALKFLASAQRLSPMNLRRQLLLGKCFQEVGKKAEAFTMFRTLHKRCPAYPGLHARMAALGCELAKGLDDIEVLRPVIAQIPDRGLVSLYKRAHEGNAEFKAALLHAVVSELSLRANAQIRNKDYYGAVKQYNHIDRLVPEDDAERRSRLHYCYARAYMLAGELAKAKSHIAIAVSTPFGADPRYALLATQIDDRLRAAAAGALERAS